MEAYGEAGPEDLLAHAAWIRALARGLVGDSDTADDLVQDTWVAALRRRPGTDRPLRPWLARVVVNFARQRARREAAAPRRSPRDPAELPSDEELATRAELQSKLVRCVLELREPYRSTVLLRYYEGLPAVEIARRQGLPDATVRSRLRRALRELRQRLDHLQEGGRRAWSLAFAPLVADRALVASSLLQGAIAMKAGWKAGIAVGLVLVVSVGGWGVARAVWPAHEQPVAPAREAELARPAAEQPLPVERAASPVQRPEREQVPAAAPEAVAVRAPWAGLLVDERTGEPLPEFRFTVRQGEIREDLETDVQGRAVSEAEFAAGELRLTFVDHPDVPRRVVLDRREVRREEADTLLSFEPDRRREDEVPVKVGPTYHLDLAGADLDPAGLSATIVSGEPGWTEYLRQIQSSPLRGGSLPWVRFAGLATGILSKRGPWTLEVTGPDGLWMGRSEVDSIEGIYPRRVPVTLEAHGRVLGTVRDGSGAVIEGAAIRLTPLERPDGEERWFAQSDESGHFAIDWVSPGRYELSVKHPGHLAEERELSVASLESLAVEPVLESLPDGGAIRGTLRSRTGTYVRPVVLLLEPKALGRERIYGEVEWTERDGEQVGTFVFESVPAGEYELSLQSFMDKFAWTPTTATVRPPADGIELVCEDDVATRNIAFNVLDGSGERIEEHFKLLTSTGGGALSGLGGLSSGQLHLVGVPAEGRFDWAVAAEGYATFFGDESDFEGENSYAEGDTVWVDVRLERGWARRLRVLDSETRRPIPGVEIVLDGEAVASTDEQGQAWVRRPAEPARTEFRHPRWELAAGSNETDSFGFGAYRLWHTVLLSAR